ncbi:TOMM precursor leader peptide-binding protein [Janibacter limosus]|uniref:TOMM precursor leader peptide-binding protein n=1 Tax=Janibacter limosus TaxID=53458 RepID=UPI000A065054|nr:TOMM precursor leader peptide-binding protein [Janibacter limosus]
MMHSPPLPPRGARLRPLRRPDGSVQLGVGPRSVRLIGLTDAEVRWLAALDPERALTEALTTASLEGIEPGRATDVLDRLIARGLLSPVVTDHLPSVAVVGSGALPALLTDVLRQGEQVGVTRVRAGGEGGCPDLAVIVSPAPADPAAAQPWLAAGTPVLPLWCQPDHASIGPIITPGGRPCLYCLDLTRMSVDPDWPHLRAQLIRPRVTGPEPADGLPALRLVAAGLTTALVLDHVAGRLTMPEWSFEVATPGPTLERHRWPAHPGCPECGSPADAAGAGATPTPRRGSRHHSGWGDTMAG